MATTLGTISVQAQAANTARLYIAAATAGTPPYTYQWHRATTSGFTPGGGTAISGATAQTLNDSGLIPNSTYFYKVVATDAAASSATAGPATVVTTPAQVSYNAFNQSPIAGMLDLRMNVDTVSVMIDASQATNLYPGQAVKFVDSAGGVPKVVGVTADTDEVYGFLNYDAKVQFYKAGSAAEMSMAGNFMWLYATTAIARGAQVTLSAGVGGTPSGVSQAVGSSGKELVGWAYDKATNPGDLIRVRISSPSFKVA